jgi:hypothetical protein
VNCVATRWQQDPADKQTLTVDEAVLNAGVLDISTADPATILTQMLCSACSPGATIRPTLEKKIAETDIDLGYFSDSFTAPLIRL